MCQCGGSTNRLTTPAISSQDLPTITQATNAVLVNQVVAQQNNNQEVQQQLNQQFRNLVARKYSVYR